MKVNSILSPMAALLLAMAPCRASAQSPGPASPADAEWALLEEALRSTSAAGDVVADLVRDADRLREFYIKHPTHAEARNARCLEGLVLVRAWLAGDTSQEARRQEIVAGVRHDKSVETELRAELFALSDSVEIIKRPDLSRDDRLLAYEQATRALIAEFPNLPNGYESLMHIARDSSQARAPGLAAEVAGMTAAPQWVRDEAQFIADRFALVGQSLPDLALAILGPGHALAEAGGRPTIVYTWSVASAPSIFRARAMAERAPAGAVIIGVCLDDGNLAAAQAQAAADGLPGESIYDERGHRGELARRLKLAEPGLIYVADAAGIIRSVSTQHTLDPTVALAGR